jgi:peptide/nickel transport system substrate-binding protein
MADYEHAKNLLAGIEVPTRLTRRSFMRRAAVVGMSIPAFGALLAACGSSSNETPSTSSASTSASTAQATSPAGGASPAATTASTAASTTTAASTAASSPTQASSGLGPIEPAKSKGGQVIEGTFADAKTVNPVLQSDTSSGRVNDLIFNSVMTVDPSDTSPKGELAEKFNISDDGLTYTFNLRDGVQWHDGQPFSAQDVKFSFDMYMNPDSGSPRTSELTERIDTLEATDDKTITVKLKVPNAAFLVSNMIYNIIPQHVLKDVDAKGLAQDAFSTGQKGRTIGTGPFMFDEWVKDDHMTLTKNANYWEGEPNLDKYIYKVVPDQNVLVQQLKTGEIDYGTVTEESVDELSKRDDLNIVQYDTFGFTFYSYQLDTAKTNLFQDKAVRQALFYALDRKAMIDAIRYGIGKVAVGTMPVVSWAYNPDGITNKYDHDVDKAKKLLDDAGWKAGSDGIRAKDGTKLAFEVYTNSGNKVREQYLTVMQQQWKEIGVDMTPKTEEWNAFLDRITGTKDFQIFLVGFNWDTDPDQTTMWATDSYTGGFNMNKYSNPKVDDLLKQGLATTDQAKRKDIYTQMQNIVMDDLPSPIMDFPKGIYGVNKRVHNVFPNAVDLPFNAHQWWVDAK